MSSYAAPTQAIEVGTMSLIMTFGNCAPAPRHPGKPLVYVHTECCPFRDHKRGYCSWSEEAEIGSHAAG